MRATKIAYLDQPSSPLQMRRVSGLGTRHIRPPCPLAQTVDQCNLLEETGHMSRSHTASSLFANSSGSVVTDGVPEVSLHIARTRPLTCIGIRWNVRHAATWAPVANLPE